MSPKSAQLHDDRDLRSSTGGHHEVKSKLKRTDAGVIPRDWSHVRIGDKAEKVGSGITPTGGVRNYKQSGRPFLRSQNIGWGNLLLKDVAFIDDETHQTFAGSEIRVCDILLNITGASIGRSAVADQNVNGGNVNQHVCIIRTSPEELDPHFLKYFLLSANGQRQIDGFQAGGNRQGLNFAQIRSFVLPYPNLVEQQAIAEALSDVDGALTSLDVLIEKKRAIKQGAMEQLLTGKSRLPGYSTAWETKRLGDIAQIKTGSRNSQDKSYDGRYPFFVRSASVERIGSYSFDGEAILVPGEGGIGSIFHYINGRFDVHQRVYRIAGFSAAICGKFLYYAMLQHFGMHAMQNTVKATVHSLRLPTFKNFHFAAPKSVAEQSSIANVLSDMDAEIKALEHRRDKTKRVKEGMMQGLLTGRIRLEAKKKEAECTV